MFIKNLFIKLSTFSFLIFTALILSSCVNVEENYSFNKDFSGVAKIAGSMPYSLVKDAYEESSGKPLSDEELIKEIKKEMGKGNASSYHVKIDKAKGLIFLSGEYFFKNIEDLNKKLVEGKSSEKGESENISSLFSLSETQDYYLLTYTLFNSKKESKPKDDLDKEAEEIADAI